MAAFGPQRVKRYTISTTKIGEGGYGNVYSGSLHLFGENGNTLRRRVAVKVFKESNFSADDLSAQKQRYLKLMSDLSASGLLLPKMHVTDVEIKGRKRLVIISPLFTKEGKSKLIRVDDFFWNPEYQRLVAKNPSQVKDLALILARTINAGYSIPIDYPMAIINSGKLVGFMPFDLDVLTKTKADVFSLITYINAVNKVSKEARKIFVQELKKRIGLGKLPPTQRTMLWKVLNAGLKDKYNGAELIKGLMQYI